MGGCIVHGALNDAEQQWLYEELLRLSDSDSPERLLDRLQSMSTAEAHAEHNANNLPQALVYWVHPYRRSSTARRRPAKLLRWAQQLMHALAPASNEQRIDSMLAQLYACGGFLGRHKDEGLSWGLSVSLGSAAKFDCLPAGRQPHTVTVRSGDILVGEASDRSLLHLCRPAALPHTLPPRCHPAAKLALATLAHAARAGAHSDGITVCACLRRSLVGWTMP